MMKIKVYFERSIRTIKEEYDDEENVHSYIEGKRFLEVEEFDSCDVELAFAKEDGDGDDTGSWSLHIKLITDPEGKILFTTDKYQTPWITDVWEDYNQALNNKDTTQAFKHALQALKGLDNLGKSRSDAFVNYKKRCVEQIKFVGGD